MFAAWIAVCLIGTPAGACNQSTAVDWFSLPDAQTSPTSCFMQGELYAAQSRLLHENEYIKVICTRTRAKGEGLG